MKNMYRKNTAVENRINIERHSDDNHTEESAKRRSKSDCLKIESSEEPVERQTITRLCC